MEEDTQGLAFIQEGNRQWECASLKVFKSERDTQKEREVKERVRGRGRGREAERGREAVSKVSLSFFQNSTVLMLRYSESDHAVFLDNYNWTQSLQGGGESSQCHLGG